MKISKHLEEGIYVLLILATQKGLTPLKSHSLSQILGVSDSSLKKILRQLVVANLIESQATKDGGFSLKKSIADISLKDVLFAIESSDFISHDFMHLGNQIFPNQVHTQQSEALVLKTLLNAQNHYADELEQLKLSDLLMEETIKSGAIDWKKRLRDEV